MSASAARRCDNARLEASENLNPTGAAIGEGRWTGKLDQLRSHADGDPNVRRTSRLETVEPAGGNTDYGEWIVVEMNRSVQNGLERKRSGAARNCDSRPRPDARREFRRRLT